MKILVATGIYPPQIGGPATYAKLLYDELPKRGIDVEVVSFGDFLDKPKGIRHFQYFMEILEKGRDADMIYALDPVSVGLPALFASQILAKKLILRIAGDYAWEQGTQRYGVTDNLDVFSRAYEKYPRQVKIFKKIQKYVADGAKKIIVPSRYLKDIVGAWGVENEKIKVVYNGFHMEPVRETPSVLRKKLSLSGNIIVSVGRLVPWKGMKELVEIIPRILEKVPDTKLVIIGDGPERENIEKRVSELNLNQNVVLVGRLDQKKAFEYVKAADLFVLNTSYEGFSHQILETMALGTALITTRAGGNTEIIRDGENGRLINIGDKENLSDLITGLLADPKKAAALARAAKKDVAKFTDEEMLARLTEELK